MDKAGEKAKGGFSKEQLLASKRFEDRRDVLSAVLAENKAYTLDEAQTLVEGFLKRKVW